MPIHVDAAMAATASLEGGAEAVAPRIWVTGMWGFSPEVEGYVGFTRESTRLKYIQNASPGDLMLIVGQKGEFSDPHDVGRTLGLVELDLRLIHESEAMSEEAYRKKVATFDVERWQFAMPILRAWRVTREIKSRYVAPETCAPRNARVVGANFLLLQPAEREKVLGLPLKRARVWGNPEWSDGVDTDEREQVAEVAVSRGPRPSFGPRTSNYEDGENRLYVMGLTGCVDALFPQHRPTASRRRVVKVGRSNSVLRREAELNAGFPPNANAAWKVICVQVFPSADEAHDAEQSLLDELKNRSYAIGREFALIPEREIDGLIANVAGRSAFHI